MQRICVFCGSSPGASRTYTAVAEAAGATLARRRLAKVWHPDLAPPGKQLEHERHIKAINDAADQLSRLAEGSPAEPSVRAITATFSESVTGVEVGDFIIFGDGDLGTFIAYADIPDLEAAGVKMYKAFSGYNEV